jgi:hypothetical protein
MDRIETKFGRQRLVAVFILAVAIGCRDTTAPSPLRLGPFSAWSDPVNLGPVVGSASNESGPSISSDGLHLYFQSNRPGGFGRTDMYVTQRATVNDAWAAPQNLGPVLNATGAFFNGMPEQSADEKSLFFCSDRPGGVGLLDLWVSHRSNIHDDFAWEAPVNLGAAVNGPTDDCDPALLVDPQTGAVILSFASLNRPGGTGDWDLLRSTQGADGNFGTAVPVSELNSATRETGPTVRRDGLEMIFSFSLNGSGDLGLITLWASTRESPSAPWSQPVALASNINAPGFNTRAADLSADGTTLYFISNRTGGSGGGDVWVSMRSRQ